MKLSSGDLLFLATILALTGCSETTVQPLAENSLEGTWTLTELDGKPVPAEPPVTVGIAGIVGDKIFIQGPVNRINGSFTGGTLGPMISTRMAGPPELMDYEQKLLASLEGATLALQSAGANTLAVQKANKTVATLVKTGN